jgi:signal transduction histidine kinase
VTVLRIATFDPTVLGFAISGVVGLVAIGRFKLLDVPLARARVVEEIDSGVLVYGRDGTVYDYNERAASLLALSPDVLETDVRTVLADSALELAFPASVAPRAASHEQTTGGVPGDRAAAVSDGGVDSVAAYLDGRTVAVEGEDGSSYVELQLSDLHDAAAGQPSRVVLLYDVSDRERRKRALEEKNEFLDEFASVVSHDVATPLGVIENKARLVEVTGDPSHAADIYEATERVQALVDELRDLAREGVQVGETTTVDLETVAREAWTSVESTDAALTVADSRTVEADRSRLRQLFENLFRNAVDHATGDESVEIEVKTTASSFSVADDGPGIPRSEREQVFEQGYTTTEDGSGLGLAIVRRIVEGHGWTVRATESDAGGARFVVDTE